MEQRIISVLNLGAGVQSTRLYLEHDFDVAIFADTQEEPQKVYDHLEWLKSLKRTPILVRSRGSLGQNLLHGVNADGGRFVSIPAFVDSDGIGVGRRQCTSEYKILVIQRAIRRDVLGLKPGQRIPNGMRVRQFYGITIDEAGRAERIKRNAQVYAKWSIPTFPFIERFISRKDCIEWLRNYGIPHEVPRSACTFCPYKSNYEWRLLRDTDPVGWRRALEIDAALRTTAVSKRGLRHSQYLHRSCKPLAEADIDNNSYGAQYTLGFSTQCTGGCGL